MNIDIIRKLTSRKFLTAIGNFVTMLIIAFNGPQELAVKISALILAAGGIIAYIVSEGATDVAAINSEAGAMLEYAAQMAKDDNATQNTTQSAPAPYIYEFDDAAAYEAYMSDEDEEGEDDGDE